jgi:hypothetical protein
VPPLDLFELVDRSRDEAILLRLLEKAVLSFVSQS